MTYRTDLDLVHEQWMHGNKRAGRAVHLHTTSIVSILINYC